MSCCLCNKITYFDDEIDVLVIPLNSAISAFQYQDDVSIRETPFIHAERIYAHAQQREKWSTLSEEKKDIGLDEHPNW